MPLRILHAARQLPAWLIFDVGQNTIAMGLSIEFYAGEADAIGAAFTDVRLEGLRDGSIAHSYADFSLHISVTDLDVLSEQAAGMLAREPVRLLESLGRHVGGTADESSADVVARTWVEFIAAVPKGSASELSAVWLSAVMMETGEEIDVHSPDAARAVEELIQLCCESLARRTDVVFAWYL
jgi:hypothetical protein